MSEPSPASGSLLLPDGRGLCYADWGLTDGAPILLFHGMPGSRLFGPPDIELPASLGVRLITVDRPGYGNSTPHRKRRLLDWPEDVGRLVDHLGIGRFSVAGVSGGGPHALACAVRMPDRVRNVGLPSTMVPFNRDARRGMNRTNAVGFSIARRAPWLLRPMLGFGASVARRDPERFADGLARGFAEPDQLVFRRPEVKTLNRRDFAEAMVQGAAGWASDVATLARPWGLQPEDVATRVLLWHGTEDRNVPAAAVQRLIERLPACEPHLLAREGHLSFHGRWPEILRQLAGSAE